MGDRVAELLLQLEDVGRRLAEIHNAVRLPDHVAVAGMQLDDLDPVMLRGEHPMPSLGHRMPLALRRSHASLDRGGPQGATDHRPGGEARRRMPPPTPGPYGHGAAILARKPSPRGLRFLPNRPPGRLRRFRGAIVWFRTGDHRELLPQSATPDTRPCEP